MDSLGATIARVSPSTVGAGVALSAILLLCSPASAQEVDTVETPRTVIPADGWPLAPGDAIRLFAWREEEINRDFAVDESGAVVLPMLGRISVVDVDLTELHDRLQEEYSRQLRSGDIEITFLRRVSILGAVTTPGLYHLDPTMTLTDALALAGGVTSIGRIDNTQILRGEEDISPGLDVLSPLLRQINSGDTVYVPEKSWLSRYGVGLLVAVIGATAIIYAATIR